MKTPKRGSDVALQAVVRGDCAYQGDDMIELFSSGLLSKWGFHDGDILGSLLSDHGFSAEDEVLFEVIKRKLIPVLHQNVEIQLISSHHNPVRAVSVDGVDVRRFACDPDYELDLTPESVSVSINEILEIAKDITSPNPRHEPRRPDEE